MKSEQELKDKYGKGFSQNRYFVFNPVIDKRVFPNQKNSHNRKIISSMQHELRIELLITILVLLSMKTRTYSIFFLLILILYILRPVMPFIEYVLNKEYIAKNLCINRDKPKSCCEGKCHLKKQLAKSDSANDSEGNNNTKKLQQKHFDEFVKTQINVCSVFEVDLHFPTFRETKLSGRFASFIFVPPQTFTTIRAV